MGSKERIKGFLAALWGTVNTEKKWVVFLANQAKWAVGFFIRVLTIVLTILLTLVVIKKLDIVPNIRSLVLHDIIGIKNKETGIISTPDIDYQKDLKSIDEIIEMLETKKREADNAKKNRKDIK